MQYQAIAMELLNENPALCARLKASRTMLRASERYAHLLKSLHEEAMEQLRQVRPMGAPEQISSEALELAVEDLRARIAAESPPSAGGSDSSQDASSLPG